MVIAWMAIGSIVATAIKELNKRFKP